MPRWLLLALLVLLPAVPRAQEVPLVAALSRTDIEVTTGFTGASLVVFGSTEQPIGPGGDEVLVIARGPTRPVAMRFRCRRAAFGFYRAMRWRVFCPIRPAFRCPTFRCPASLA